MSYNTVTLASMLNEGFTRSGSTAEKTVWNICRYGSEWLLLQQWAQHPESWADGMPRWPIWGKTEEEMQRNRQELVSRFAERYYFNEIAQETTDAFIFAFTARMMQLMPYYAKVGNTRPDEPGTDFETITETHGTTHNESDAHTTSGSKSATYGSEFPQGNMNGSLSDPRYLATGDRSEGEGAGSSSGKADGRDERTTRVTGRNQSEVKHWEEFKSACVDLISEIVSRLEDLFQVSYGMDPDPALFPDPYANIWPGSSVPGSWPAYPEGGTGEKGEKGDKGDKGDPGPYYKPGVTQPSTGKIRFSWTVEGGQAPTVPPVDIDLPGGGGLTPEQEAILATVPDKMEKHLLSISGNTIMDGSTVCTHSYLKNLLEGNKAFVVLLYGTRAYHPQTVDSTVVEFISTDTNNGLIQVKYIAIKADNSISITSAEAEKTANKVAAITSADKGNASKYPSIKAVVEYVDGIVGLMAADMAELAAYAEEVLA